METAETVQNKILEIQKKLEFLILVHIAQVNQ
jgi:hypothetical protein